MTVTVRHLDRRTELLDALTEIALQEASAPTSLRQFAIRVGVSEPTLRHYFNDRQGVVIAIIEHLALKAASFWEQCANPGADLADAIHGYVDLAMSGFANHSFARAHAFALVESIHDPVVAKAYLTVIIEPSLVAIEHRLAPKLDPEGKEPDRVRHTALFVYAPILMAVLHQRLLQGQHVRPLNIADYTARLTEILAQAE